VLNNASAFIASKSWLRRRCGAVGCNKKMKIRIIIILLFVSCYGISQSNENFDSVDNYIDNYDLTNIEIDELLMVLDSIDAKFNYKKDKIRAIHKLTFTYPHN